MEKARRANPAMASDFDWESVRELMRRMQQSKDKLAADLTMAAVDYAKA